MLCRGQFRQDSATTSVLLGDYTMGLVLCICHPGTFLLGRQVRR